jgi:CheY-like chemotaxis protein
MSDPMKCLILDDDHGRLREFRSWLNEPGVEITCVETAVEAIAKLASEQYHCVFLDHDLGGEVYVDSNREDCGMEVVRQLKAGTITQDPRCLFVVHTMNTEAGREMVAKLNDKGYLNVVYQGFFQMRAQGGPKLSF